MGTVSCSPSKRYTPDSGINMSSMTGSETLSPDLQILSGPYHAFHQDLRTPAMGNEGGQPHGSHTHPEVNSNVFTFSGVKTTNSPSSYTDTAMGDPTRTSCMPKGTVPLSHAPGMIQDMGVALMTSSSSSVRSHFGVGPYAEVTSMSSQGHMSQSAGVPNFHRQYYGGYEQYHGPPLGNSPYCHSPYGQKPLPYLNHLTPATHGTQVRAQAYHQKAHVSDCVPYSRAGTSSSSSSSFSLYGGFSTTVTSSNQSTLRNAPPPLLSLNSSVMSEPVGKSLDIGSGCNTRSGTGGLQRQQTDEKPKTETSEEKSDAAAGGVGADKEEKLLIIR